MRKIKINPGVLEQAIMTAVVNKRAGGTGLISGHKAFQKPMKDEIDLLFTSD